MKTWEKTKIKTDCGKWVEAISPVIVSASRSTDIPAFYSKWFFNRIEKGYLVWINPFNRKEQFVSFDKCRLIVFWTKNAEAVIPYLKKLDEGGINYYFQYTVNDYEMEGLEPNVPELSQRIDTFIGLSSLMGPGRVIWRFDPLILTRNLTTQILLERIYSIAGKLKDYTEKLVISFADIQVYRKVQQNLNRSAIKYEDFGTVKMIEFASGLQQLNNEFGFVIGTCGEEIELSQFGIEKNRCVDDELMVNLFKHDRDLMDFIGYTPNPYAVNNEEVNYRPNPRLKDKGQRKLCGCIMSKDIGMYNTCNHLCSYCYANNSVEIVSKNIALHNPEKQSII